LQRKSCRSHPDSRSEECFGETPAWAVKPPAGGNLRIWVLLVACFAGVCVLKRVTAGDTRQIALACWFFASISVWERTSRSKPDARCQEIGMEREPTDRAPSAGLNESNVIVAWLRKPRSTVGVTMVALYAVLAVFVFTHFKVGNQWQPNDTGYVVPFMGAKQVFLLSVLVPIYEEAFFRGSVLRSLLFRPHALTLLGRKISWLGPIYLNSLVFWLFHLPPDFELLWRHFQVGSLPLAPGSFFLGLACGYITYKDRSIWMAVVLHGLANAAGPLWAPALQHMGLFDVFFVR